MNWLPIETAPRDTDVLVYFEFATVPIVHIARRGSRERWEESGQYCGITLEDFLSWWSYTRDSVRKEKLEGFCSPWYWMPLPNVPGNGEEFDEQEIAYKLSELNEKSNRGDILQFLVKAKVPFTTEIDSTSYRVQYVGSYLYKISAYNIEWTFLPTGVLEQCFTKGPK